jgi:hypothetical protein
MSADADIRDMSRFMIDLADVAADLDGAIRPEYVERIEAVVSEWDSYTKPRIEELVENQKEDE